MTTLEIVLIVLVIVLLIILVGVGIGLILVIKRLLWTLAKFSVIAEVVDRVVGKAATVLGKRNSESNKS